MRVPYVVPARAAFTACCVPAVRPSGNGWRSPRNAEGRIPQVLGKTGDREQEENGLGALVEAASIALQSRYAAQSCVPLDYVDARAARGEVFHSGPGN